MKTLSNSQKRTLIRFVLAGVGAVIIKKIETAANKKADEMYPSEDDEKTTKED